MMHHGGVLLLIRVDHGYPITGLSGVFCGHGRQITIILRDGGLVGPRDRKKFN